ncbi:MAG: GNAT family N-acetyltransferase [Proteobacteria bacterium]|nr:GNAT family N-acetyltransferase [Pseudomonadota bacterium]
MFVHDNPLLPLVKPGRIAVFGSGPVARGLLRNLAAGSLAGKIHYLGSEAVTQEGVACHAVLDEIPGQITLVAVTSPLADLHEILAACARKGARVAILYSLVEGREQQLQLSAEAARLGIRLFGPKALGCILPHARLNLSAMELSVPAGNLALVSQSASVCANILDWSHNDEFGFSAIFGPGLSSDLELPEILDYLATDLKTESILIYLEGLHHPRRFLSAVRAAAMVKPVITLKGGRHAASAPLAAAHSGALVDRDDAFDAALRRAGVLRVLSIGDMFSAARALATPRKPRGNRLAIVANGGAPAVLALDQAAEDDIVAASLTPETLERLRSLVLADWSAGNPIDLGLDAAPENWLAAISACTADPGVDGVLAILTPNSVADPLDYARLAIDSLRRTEKPVLACLLGEVRSRAARAAFAQARFPTFRTAENAVSAFAFMMNWVRNQILLLETPAALSSYIAPNTAQAQGVIEAHLRGSGRMLSLPDAKSILAAFRIPVTPSESATTPTEAVAVASRLGYPVAMKSGGNGRMRLGLRSAAEVALAFRELHPDAGASVYLEPHIDRPQGRWLSISIRTDQVFGPVITLSEAGIAPEIYDARSIALPPLNPRLVGDMIGVPHVARLLGPIRHNPAVALAPLEAILLRVSEMASELPWLHALDITLEADERGAVAVDAKAEVRQLAEGGDRYGHMAIYPYPSQLVGEWTLKDGSTCTIRPIRPDDAVMFQDFVRGLTAQSRHMRFFSTMRELPQSSLARFVQLDFGRELALIATAPGNGQQKLLGEANYSCLPGGKTCEFAVVIADDMGGRGLASRLMRCLIAAACAQGIAIMRGQVLADNEAMLALMETLGFDVKLTDEVDIVEVSRHL